MVDLNINRPIYLALRDKLYMKAVGLLKIDYFSHSIEERYNKLKEILYIFSETKKNARFAMRGSKLSPDEDNFIKCLEMIIDSLEAAQIMTSHENLLEHDKNYLSEFLAENLKAFNIDEDSSRKFACQIINRTRILVDKVTRQFEILSKNNFEDLHKDFKERYHMMFNRIE